MKTYKMLVAVAAIGLIAVGCNKTENVLTKKDGLWQLTYQSVELRQNDSLISSQVATDSLNQIFFDKDGTGYTADFSGNNKVNFTWTADNETEEVTITDTSGTAVVWGTAVRTKTEMDWWNTQTTTVGGDVFETKTNLTTVRK